MNPDTNQARRNTRIVLVVLICLGLVLWWRWRVGMDFLDLACLMILTWSICVGALGYLAVGLWKGARMAAVLVERRVRGATGSGRSREAEIVPATAPLGRGSEPASARSGER
jgi:hypothetical protein